MYMYIYIYIYIFTLHLILKQDHTSRIENQIMTHDISTQNQTILQPF